jgi:outer membrane protein assembly factor BamB
MADPTPASSPSSDTRPPLRWKPYAVVTSAVAVAVLGIRVLLDDPGIVSMATTAGVLVIFIMSLVWFLFRAGFSWQVRLIGLVVLVGLFGAAAAAGVRFHGYRGDMTPDITGPWSRSKGVAQFPARKEAEKSSDASKQEPTPKIELKKTPHDYPGFLGADRTATVRGIKLARDWQARPPKELWRIPVGLGWSAFSVEGDLAVTQEQRGEEETVVAYELRTGKQLWVHADKALFQEALGGNGPRATPTIRDGRIFALGATGVLNCLDATSGDVVWTRNILKDAGANNIIWGMSGSPLVYDDLVVVNPGGPKGYSVVAYEASTGKMAWHAGSGQAAYSSPTLATLSGVRQVLILNGPGLEAYGAEDGRELWNFPWVTQESQMINASQPVVLPGDGKDSVFVSTGYNKGSVMLQVTGTEGKFSVEELWRSRKSLRAKFTNIVVRDGFGYALDEKILACIDLKDGAVKWKERAGQYDYGQIILVDDVILVQAESGEVALVSATPDKFQELTRFPPLANKTWNNPALVGRLLLVRNDREAACYELPVEGE